MKDWEVQRKGMQNVTFFQGKKKNLHAADSDKINRFITAVCISHTKDRVYLSRAWNDCLKQQWANFLTAGPQWVLKFDKWSEAGADGYSVFVPRLVRENK